MQRRVQKRESKTPARSSTAKTRIRNARPRTTKQLSSGSWAVFAFSPSRFSPSRSLSRSLSPSSASWDADSSLRWALFARTATRAARRQAPRRAGHRPDRPDRPDRPADRPARPARPAEERTAAATPARSKTGRSDRARTSSMSVPAIESSFSQARSRSRSGMKSAGSFRRTGTTSSGKAARGVHRTTRTADRLRTNPEARRTLARSRAQGRSTTNARNTTMTTCEASSSFSRDALSPHLTAHCARNISGTSARARPVSTLGSFLPDTVLAMHAPGPVTGPETSAFTITPSSSVSM